MTSTSKRKLLFVKLSAMGDIVHAMPAAMDIKRSLPDIELHWVVQGGFRELLQHHPAVDKLIPISKRPTFSELKALKRTLRAEHYDFALDMQGLFKSARIIAISGATRKLGFQWQREGSRWFSRAVKSTALHVVDQYRDVAKAIGANQTKTEFGLSATSEAIVRAQQLLAPLPNDKKRVAINLGSAKAEKQWPFEKFVELVKSLQRQGLVPFLIGGPSDVKHCERLNNNLEAPVLNLAGKTSLSELVAVIQQSHLHIGGDTGSIHIAAALGVPVVCLMGPTDPDRSGPYRQRESVLYEGKNGLPTIEVARVSLMVSNKI